MKLHHFAADTFVPRPLDEVFAFFSDPRNLERLTPPAFGFQNLAEGPVAMRAGALLDHRIRVHGVPLRWQSEITAWEPPRRFVDEQRRGPYRRWRHEHRFEPQDGGTLVLDRVEYAVPGWLLEPLVHRLFVRPDLERIFAWRQAQMKALWG